jgi:hypothetical protein
MPLDPEDIKNRVTYHPPTEEKIRKHSLVRGHIQTVMEDFNETLPEGREKSLVFTKLEEVMFWANAAVGRQ